MHANLALFAPPKCHSCEYQAGWQVQLIKGYLDHNMDVHSLMAQTMLQHDCSGSFGVSQTISGQFSVIMSRGLKAADRRASLDAAWILTNVAAGEHAIAAAAVPAGPILVAHLGAGLGLELSQQCAWALGELCISSCLLQSPLLAPIRQNVPSMMFGRCSLV